MSEGWEIFLPNHQQLYVIKIRPQSREARPNLTRVVRAANRDAYPQPRMYVEGPYNCGESKLDIGQISSFP